MKILRLGNSLFLAAFWPAGVTAQNRPFEGDPSKLQNNGPPGQLNTGRGAETAQQKEVRMSRKVPPVDPFEDPDPNIGPFDQDDGPFRDPLIKAKCIGGEAYTVAKNFTDFFEDYEKIFDWGFNNTMGPPLQSRSLDNNKVTNNRFPSMFLRMCFHDNSIDSDFPRFDEYVATNIDDSGNWKGPQRFLETSGADASVLICPEERYHPNQNYDQTASRILYALQTDETGIVDGSGERKSMVDKYDLSYADLLHNGGVAAALYLTSATTIPDAPFTFGRRDACHLPAQSANKRFELCGPTENLPGILMEAKDLNSWFYRRGMNECTWLALMWTHTVMDNMAVTCPLLKLPATTSADDMDELDKFRQTSRIYFKANDTLDYFDFFLNQGNHVPTPAAEVVDFEKANCKWKRHNHNNDTRRYHWPMTRPDCVLGQEAAEGNASNLATAIKAYHAVSPSNKTDALLYALSILSGGDNGAIPVVTGCSFENTTMFPLFGAYFVEA